ncbi:nucleoporin Ndc1-like [Euwallacea similis]|uniref:nucleoporin Ndc1-like n=1 Tax=Euwallacea similis TaxID=1736056 RepID=UPI00344B7129
MKMYPNLTGAPQTVTYKDLLLQKLSYAVISSVLSQFIILQLYVFFANISVLHPMEWLLAALHTMTSANTRVFIIPFITIIFAQSITCAKDYKMKPSYSSTRFQKFLAAFSVHNFVLLLLHVGVGAMLIWLYLSISRSPYENLTELCMGQVYCLNEGSFFLILSGLWIGLYYFVKICMAEKNLAFPVIHQRKFLQLKSQLMPLIKESVIQSFWPCIVFISFYYFYGFTLKTTFKTMFGLIDYEVQSNIFIYFRLWFFGTLYYTNMSLMRFYFNLFLTEPVQFPLVKHPSNSLTLQESITNSEWPIVQNLACLDLYLLAQWSPIRRQVLFSISVPGGHPHNWNLLVENILKLFSEYTQLLNKTIDLPEKQMKPQVIQAPLIQRPDRFRNLRNMALVDHDNYNYDVDVSKSPVAEFSFPNRIFLNVCTRITATWNVIKVVTGINFMFGELPQANIRKCLANGNLIIWTSQGIAELVTTSLEEDKFGVVQKDLPAIITSLVSLKQSLDKLNKVPALTRKMVGYDNFNCKMKGAVTAAVKRSLFNVCKCFAGYLKDVPLSKEVFSYLETHVICRS